MIEFLGGPKDGDVEAPVGALPAVLPCRDGYYYLRARRTDLVTTASTCGPLPVGTYEYSYQWQATA